MALKDDARYSSTITIEELTGTGDGGPRKLVLRGPSMPFQGAEWSVGNTLVTKFYPGNPRGSQQNMGPKEMPANWEGEWNRTLLGKSPAIFTDETGEDILVIQPSSMVDIFEDIVRKGAPLRVTWSTHGAEVVGDDQPSQVLKVVNWDVTRDGRAGTFKFTPDRHTDIKWSVEWQWYGRGVDQSRVASVRQDNDLAKTIQSVENALAFARFLARTKAREIKDDVRLSASTLTLGQLEAIANAPSEAVDGYLRKLTSAVNDVKKVAEIARTLSRQPAAIANSVVDFSRNTTAIANQFIVSVERTPPELMSLKRKVSDQMRAWKEFAQHTDQAQVVARRAREAEDKTRQAVFATQGTARRTVRESSTTRAGDILAVYITKTGDTPDTVSLKFYETPDRGIDILQANKMPWHTATFSPGLIIVIPVLTLPTTRT